MASLITLGRVPEVLDLILNHLPSCDITSLSRTCRSLYPACNRHFWSTLSLDKLSAESARKFGILVKHLRASSENLESSSLIKYTKTIVLGHHVFGDMPSDEEWVWDVGQASEVSSLLIELFESSKVEFRCVRLVLGGNVLTDFSRQLISSIKAYAGSRSQSDGVSVEILSSSIFGFSDLFHFQSITTLVLFMWVGPPRNVTNGPPWGIVWGNQQVPWWTAPLGDTKSHILELANLFSRLPNLRKLTWSSCYKHNADPTLNYTSELTELQNVFTKLEKLREFAMYERLFHPSYFINPPQGLRKFETPPNAKEPWWRQFASCPFPNLEELVVHGEDEPNFKEFMFLRKTARTGIKRVRARGYPFPVDLLDCIYSGNDEYSLAYRSKRTLAEQKAEEIIEGFRTTIRENSKRAVLATTVNPLLPQFNASAQRMKAYNSGNLVREIAQSFRHRAIFGIKIPMENIKRAHERADELFEGTKEAIENIVKDCITASKKHLVARGEHVTGVGFIKNFIRRFPRRPQAEIEGQPTRPRDVVKWPTSIPGLDGPYDHAAIQYFRNMLEDCREHTRNEYLGELMVSYKEIPQEEFIGRCFTKVWEWRHWQPWSGWRNIRKRMDRMAVIVKEIIEELLDEMDGPDDEIRLLLVRSIMNEWERKDELDSSNFMRLLSLGKLEEESEFDSSSFMRFWSLKKLESLETRASMYDIDDV